MYLDHPCVDSRRKLVDTTSPHETTENDWRFRFPLPPAKTSKFVVQQNQTLSQSFSISDITDKQLGDWVSLKYLDTLTENTILDAVF